MDSLAPAIRKKGLNYLRRVCGRQALLPRSLTIPICYDPTENPLSHGELVDIWKGQYQGQEVAAEVLNLWSWNDPGKVRMVGYRWRIRLVVCIDELTLSRTEVLRGGHDVETPPSLECATADRRDDDRESTRRGIGADGKW